MKKLHLFKRTLLLLALIVGFVNYGWATEVTYTFTAKNWTATSGGSSANWTSGKDGGQIQSGRGVQVTTGASGANATSPESFSNISQVVVTYSTNKSDGAGSISFQVGDGTAKSQNVTKTGGTTDRTLTYNFSPAETGKVKMTVTCTTNSIYVKSVTITYNPAPAFTITAQSNNDTFGTVSLSGSVITGSPKPGYRYADPAYTVTSGTATVSQEGNAFTVTPSTDCTVQINFEAIPTYTVTFNAEGGTCVTTSATEAIGGAGVTLPTATTGVAGWEFAGWAADAVDNTTTQPTLYKAGSTYYPTSATTLHAVYTLKETTSTFVRVTSVNQVEFAKSIVVVKNNDNFVLNHSRTAGVAAPEESAGEITAPANTIFALTGDNSDGFVLTGENGTLSQTTVSTSDSNDRVTDWSGYNNQWKIEANAYATNTFALSNSTNVALEYYSGWKTEYNTSYNNRQYTAMKLYVPKSAYDSNPSALTAPTVEFDSTDPVTLYLDGTTTNTNTATVTGVSKTINYTSSNTGVATVNSEGVVTAVGIGTTTITASVDAELGVSAPASDTYEVTVKSATTLAGIKAQATSSTAVDFTADLASDLVITYVNGSHAYLQSGDVAVYASCATGDWEAGKKFTGAITGQIKRLNNEYQITSIDQTPVAGGVVPDAIEVAITDLTTANYATYEGRKIAINGATVNTKMTDTDLTGGKITTDGTNTLNIYAREKGITLTKDEKGNFVGYIGRYNDGIRYYMYEQSQFTKTHNAPQNQVMSFTKSSYNLDEETDAVTDFAGQEVTKTTVKGAVTYSIKDGSDDIITSLNSSTGAVVLNGDCGTATIVATAAYAEEEDEGIITPYPALSKEYTVTVRPRYMVTFSVNGVETVLRQATSGASIDVPTPSDFGDYKFMGWSESTVDPTDDEPSMTDLGATVIPTDNDDKYFAVFAKQAIVPDVEQTSTFTFKGSAVSSPYENNEATWTFTSVSFGSQNYGLQSQSITLTPSANVTSVKEITIKKSNTWGQTVTLTMTDASSNQIFQIKNGNFTSNLYTEDITSNQSSSYTFTSSGKAWIEYITLTYLAPALAYADYRTSLPTVEVTITDAQYATFCYERELDVTGTDVTAYTASANGEGNAVTLTKISDGIIPANTGVILFAESAGNYEINVSTTGKEAIAGNELVGVTTRTQIPETSADKYNYIFSKKNEVIGFYRASGAYLLPNRAYLSTSKRDAAAREFMAIMFDEGETTSLNEVRGLKADVRGEFFNLNGQRVATPVKGNIYIVNGKKVMFK